MTWHDDPVWLRAHLRDLTDHFERDQVTPWSLDDAPPDFIERLLRAIVGVELHVRSVQIKRKLSQNRSEADRQGAIAGLFDTDGSAASMVARLMVAATR